MTDEQSRLSRLLSPVVQTIRSDSLGSLASVTALGAGMAVWALPVPFEYAVGLWVAGAVVYRYTGANIDVGTLIEATGRGHDVTVSEPAKLGEPKRKCADCMDERSRTRKVEGYTVYKLAGYEIVRLIDYSFAVCGECYEQPDSVDENAERFVRDRIQVRNR